MQSTVKTQPHLGVFPELQHPVLLCVHPTSCPQFPFYHCCLVSFYLSFKSCVNSTLQRILCWHQVPGVNLSTPRVYATQYDTWLSAVIYFLEVSLSSVWGCHLLLPWSLLAILLKRSVLMVYLLYLTGCRTHKLASWWVLIRAYWLSVGNDCQQGDWPCQIWDHGVSMSLVLRPHCQMRHLGSWEAK